MTKEELLNIKGGSGISGTVLSGVIKAFTLALELGRSLGTALRRVKDKNVCK